MLLFLLYIYLILVVDIPLSHGITAVKNLNINQVEFVWDPTRDTAVFIQVGEMICILPSHQSFIKEGKDIMIYSRRRTKRSPNEMAVAFPASSDDRSQLQYSIVAARKGYC